MPNFPFWQQRIPGRWLLFSHQRHSGLLCRQPLKVQKLTLFAVWSVLPPKYLHISAGSFPNSKNGPFVGTDFWTCVAKDKYANLLSGRENTVESLYLGMTPFSFVKVKFDIWAFLGCWLLVLCPRTYLCRNLVQFWRSNFYVLSALIFFSDNASLVGAQKLDFWGAHNPKHHFCTSWSCLQRYTQSHTHIFHIFSVLTKLTSNRDIVYNSHHPNSADSYPTSLLQNPSPTNVYVQICISTSQSSYWPKPVCGPCLRAIVLGFLMRENSNRKLWLVLMVILSYKSDAKHVCIV